MSSNLAQVIAKNSITPTNFPHAQRNQVQCTLHNEYRSDLILMDFNLAVGWLTAKLPNLIANQISSYTVQIYVHA